MPSRPRPRPSLVGGRSPWYCGRWRPSKNFAIFFSASAQRCGSSLRYFSTCWSMAQFMNIARIIGAGPLMVIDTLVVGAHPGGPTVEIEREEKTLEQHVAVELRLVEDEREGIVPRSEEHTSELQSLMRISYAVFCLNTNNKPLHK